MSVPFIGIAGTIAYDPSTPILAGMECFACVGTGSRSHLEDGVDRL